MYVSMVSFVVSRGQRILILVFGLTASFRELGPPDLCHCVKSTGSGKNLREVR
jgi:hypothetical protein